MFLIYFQRHNFLLLLFNMSSRVQIGSVAQLAAYPMALGLCP
jgi:hypothetical protein